jgi:hypothetical protein
MVSLMPDTPPQSIEFISLMRKVVPLLCAAATYGDKIDDALVAADEARRAEILELPVQPFSAYQCCPAAAKTLASESMNGIKSELVSTQGSWPPNSGPTNFVALPPVSA